MAFTDDLLSFLGQHVNPFKGIIKTDIAPHNRTLRTDFGQKLEDAFTVFFGAPCQANFGLFDLCTFGIPLAIHQAWCWCLNHKDPLIQYGLGFFVGLFNIPLLVPRFLIALVLTFNPLSLLVTAIVHFISQTLAGGNELKKEALALILTSEKSGAVNLAAELARPSEHLGYNFFHSLENLRISYEDGRILAESPHDQLIKLKVNRVLINQECGEKNKMVGNKFCYLPIFADGSVDLNAKNLKALKALKALIKLNVGDVTNNFEKTEAGKEILKNIMAAPAA